MTVDHNIQPHRDTWLGFARLMRWTVGSIVLLLLLMAYFLV
ncbi:MAG TPA: aa3-type cytochrome c oxidase subunit IV [Stellaceae bacterium]|nr:aa3-type cytochrome c oxidase subunit IV [Stellaceae bacterium]